MQVRSRSVWFATSLTFLLVCLSACSAAGSGNCDEYWSKKIQADTLALTTRGDIIEELSKARPNQARIAELEIQAEALESVSEDWFERIQEAGC